MKIEVEVNDKGFSYKGWIIEPFEDFSSADDRTEVVWFGAEKQVGNTWYWIKRKSLLELISAIDKKRL